MKMEFIDERGKSMATKDWKLRRSESKIFELVTRKEECCLTSGFLERQCQDTMKEIEILREEMSL